MLKRLIFLPVFLSHRYIYEVLTNSSVASAQPEMLIACNKSDAADAKSPEKVKSLLEAELEQLKSTSTSLGDIGDEEDGIIKLGEEGKDFTFEDSPIPITFTACSATKGDFKAIDAFVRAQG